MEKYTPMTLKMGKWSHNRCQIFASCHFCKLVQNHCKYRNNFKIIRCETPTPTIMSTSQPVLRYKRLTVELDIVQVFMQTTCISSKDNAK